jgi:hypothetical protein
MVSLFWSLSPLLLLSPFPVVVGAITLAAFILASPHPHHGCHPSLTTRPPHALTNVFSSYFLLS